MEFGDYKSANARKCSTVCMQLSLHDHFQVVMKVSESKFECDFCGAVRATLHPINDGAWAICEVCMDIHYRIVPNIEERKQPKMETVKSTRYTIYGDESE